MNKINPADYKNTLNLPQTDFPMKANLPRKEPEILAFWQEVHIYEKMCEESKKREKFILHMGPPYANGHIHLGTSTNTILKDIIAKSKSLSGFFSPLVPGWDCHGLPIELNVEKKFGKPGKKISAPDFRVACREYANSQIDIQRNGLKRLGIIADWEHPYKTMDFTYEANTIRSLATIFKAGHIERGFKPVHWCLDCGSALAEAEVEYIDKDSPSIDVAFLIEDKEAFAKRFPSLTITADEVVIPIWTTTPWTLPANMAVSLNPLMQYSLIESDLGTFLIAQDLLEAVTNRYGIKTYKILGSILGEKLEGLLVRHPFYDKSVPLLLGDHVTIDTGTGAVHTAGAHGIEDFAVATKYKIKIDNPIDDHGCFTQSAGLFAGVHVNKVNPLIIDELKKRGMLIHEETLNHSYPHCWRHKTPLIFRATPQWFISMDKKGLRKLALEAVNRVTWIPDWGKARIHGMIENRPDWCISRQRVWGVPIPFIIHKTTGELHPDSKVLMEKVASMVEKAGVDTWFNLDLEDLINKEEAKEYRKLNDVLDVWFDSGVSHECVLKIRPELKFPADIYLEGSDQHRGWFHSALLTSIAMNGIEPYHEVLTHGFVVDAHGRKMSKSLGNVIDPLEVIEKLGADILRLWVASIDYKTDFAASQEILARMSETYRRIRNTARFLLANLHGFDPKKHMVSPNDLLALDRFIVDKIAQIQNEITAAYDNYQFHLIVQKIHYFCVNDLGGFYLDIIKDRQYTMKENSLGRRSAQTALYHVINALTRLMAPITSFTAEEIWKYIPGEKLESVFLTTWYDQLFTLNESEVMDQEFWSKVRDVRDAINKEIENLRNQNQIGSALEAEVELYCGPNSKHLLDLLGDELRFILITSKATVIPEHAGPLDMVVTDVPGLALKIHASKEKKCVRCWHRVASVDANPDWQGLCDRCVQNVAGEGEIRKYA